MLAYLNVLGTLFYNGIIIYVVNYFNFLYLGSLYGIVDPVSSSTTPSEAHISIPTALNIKYEFIYKTILL